MDPILQPRIFTFYFFSLYFHDPPDPPDLPTYLVFFRLVWRALGWTDARERVRYNPVVRKGTTPVDAIVEEWRAQSKKGRYEGAMWKAAGLDKSG